MLHNVLAVAILIVAAFLLLSAVIHVIAWIFHLALWVVVIGAVIWAVSHLFVAKSRT